MKSVVLLVILAIASVHAAGQPPRFPTVGSYTWELKFDKQVPNTYMGGPL